MKNAFDRYQDFTDTTAIYPNAATDLNYPILGLGSESGEIQGKWKKVIRDNGGVVSPEVHEKLVAELGDAHYYLARIARALNVKLSDVIAKNVEKLSSRKDRGVLQGSGDTR
jgi:NTP pyrophosphatase (non-canonical NTP hydrolase)